MFYKNVVQEVLKRCLTMDFEQGMERKNPASGQDSVISQLIHDLFGGEILKTPEKRGWHFYNRIEGELIDFTKSTEVKGAKGKHLKEIPATPAETSGYFDLADYYAFMMRFVRTFEEAVGLNKSQMGYSS